MLLRGRCHQLEPRMQVLHHRPLPFPTGLLCLSLDLIEPLHASAPPRRSSLSPSFPQLEPSDQGAKRVLYQLTEEMDKRGGRLALVLAGELMTPADDP